MPALKVSDKEMKNRILLGSLENRMKIMGYDKRSMAQGKETLLYMILHFADMLASRVVEKEDVEDGEV